MFEKVLSVYSVVGSNNHYIKRNRGNSFTPIYTTLSTTTLYENQSTKIQTNYTSSINNNILNKVSEEEIKNHLLILQKAYNNCIENCKHLSECNDACNLLKPFIHSNNNNYQLNNFQQVLLQKDKMNPAKSFMKDLKDATTIH
ncbi:hypothetical protein ABK040_007086 [Willaertia magna]